MVSVVTELSGQLTRVLQGAARACCCAREGKLAAKGNKNFTNSLVHILRLACSNYGSACKKRQDPILLLKPICCRNAGSIGARKHKARHRNFQRCPELGKWDPSAICTQCKCIVQRAKCCDGTALPCLQVSWCAHLCHQSHKAQEATDKWKGLLKCFFLN